MDFINSNTGEYLFMDLNAEFRISDILHVVITVSDFEDRFVDILKIKIKKIKIFKIFEFLFFYFSKIFVFPPKIYQIFTMGFPL